MLEENLSGEALWARIPQLTEEEMPVLLTHPAVQERHLVKVLQRTDLSESFLAGLARSKWAAGARVKFCLVNHPKTPLADSMNFVKFLFWRDLNLVLQNFRLPSEVRHMAESVLLQRYPTMAVGEKVTLARLAAGQVLKTLRMENEPRVIKALLENPRLVEEDVLFIVSHPRSTAPALEAVAREVKWSSRKEVRMGLLRNHKTPLTAVLPFLSSLTEVEMRSLVGDLKVPLAVRRMLQTRLGKNA